jgi:hypothetical protein
MTTPEIQATPKQIVEAFAQVAQPIIRYASHDVDSCIVSTRIAVDVFHHFRLLARPLVARKVVFNEAALRLTPDATAADYAKACIVRVGYGDGPVPTGFWSGHLVAVVEREFLVDSVADQANVRDSGIELPGVLLHTVDNAFLSARSKLYGSYGGCGVRYEAFPVERSYTSTPDWRRQPSADGESRTQEGVRAIIREVSHLIRARARA